MKSKTSYSKLTSFRKDITRFAPLWIIYFIGGMLVTLSITADERPGGVALRLTDLLLGMGIINMIYAALSANLLFGDLFNARLCNAMHAMPIRREHWFLSHVGAGLCFSLVPHTVAMLIMMLRLRDFSYIALLWMGMATLQYLFFFGVAVLSCMLVGSRFAMVVVYGIINFGSMIAQWFLRTVYIPKLYGVVMNGEVFNLLCPVVQLTSYADHDYINIRSTYNELAGTTMYYYEGLGSAWDYALVLGVIGVVFLGLALLLYRIRKLESAGDFIALKPAEPVFLLIYTLCVGALFAMVGDLISGNNGYVVFLVIGLILGFFTGLMLVKRTVRVFKLKSGIACAVLVAVMLLSMLATDLDLLGVEKWVPEAQKVRSVSINRHYYPVFGTKPTELTDQQTIQSVIDIHKQALEYKDQNYYHEWHSLTIDYFMKDGRRVTRRYDVPLEVYTQLRGVFSTPEVVFGRSADYMRQNVTQAWFHYKEYSWHINGKELMEMILKDCAEGNMSQEWMLHGDTAEAYDLEIFFLREDGCGMSTLLTVFSDAKNTTAWLENYIQTHSGND